MVEAYQNSLLDFVSTKQKITCEYGQEGERQRTKLFKLIEVPALTTANIFFPGDSHLKNGAREDLRKLREDVFPSSPSQLIVNLAVARRTWDSLTEMPEECLLLLQAHPAIYEWYTSEVCIMASGS